MQLIINTGSTSKKYALYTDEGCRALARFEKTGSDFNWTYIKRGEQSPSSASISEQSYNHALAIFLDEIAKDGDIPSVAGIRIVAPGTFFAEHRHIDADFIERLEATRPYAPLHITPACVEIAELKRVLPNMQCYALSDSAFHASIPDPLRRYSIAREDTERFDIYRFGYHGLSAASVARKLPQVLGGADAPRTIICHIGGGVSVTALQEGKSADTSMGFSPAGGSHMATRTGDIDPGALLYLAERKKLSLSELRTYINTEGGFKALYGSGDMRDVLKGYEADEARAIDAIDMFTVRIKKYIGAFSALLGGLDALVLTATANERNAFLRELVCRDLEHLGIALDDTKNKNTKEGKDTMIHRDGSSVHVAVVHTDEMGEMARVLRDIHNT